MEDGTDNMRQMIWDSRYQERQLPRGPSDFTEKLDIEPNWIQKTLQENQKRETGQWERKQHKRYSSKPKKNLKEKNNDNNAPNKVGQLAPGTLVIEVRNFGRFQMNCRK